jgi:hypothetical protein
VINNVKKDKTEKSMVSKNQKVIATLSRTALSEMSGLGIEG